MDPNLPATLRVIGEEWKARSRELADWALERLVNRLDVWGQYTTMTEKERLTSNRSYKALTLPQKKMRGKDMVTLEKLSRHFGSLRRHHLIGLHAASAEVTSRWLAIDLDLHEPEAVDAEDSYRRNFAAAVGWWEKLQALGYDPLLMDSNGAGGFHIWVLFEQPAPTADVFAFGQDIVSDWETRNLDGIPETFPKKGTVEGDKLGAWLRLPGLHHTRDHFTKVWSGEPWLDQPWQAGGAAIEAILATRPGPLPPAAPPDDGLSATAAKKKSSARQSRGAFRTSSPETVNPEDKPTVCVDLDGVLASYDGWRGALVIGDPIDGAVEFTRRVSEFAKVVIYTARLHPKGDRDLDAVEQGVVQWLDQHGFSYVSIYRGEGKPFAKAYVDDRAVACLPQRHGSPVFLGVEADVRNLCDAVPQSGADAELVELNALWPDLDEAQRFELLSRVRSWKK